MANKINSSSFFNRSEDDTANIALDLANQTFSISTALKSQVSSLVKDISAIQFLFQENDTFVHDSFLRLQQSFDTLSETVRILSGDVSALSSKFLLLEQNRAKQLDAESLRLFEKEDAEQKGRGNKGGAFGGLFGGGSGGGLGGVNQEDLSPDTGGGGLGGIAGALTGMAGFALVGGLIKGVTSLVDGVKSIGKGIGNGLKSIGNAVGDGIKSVKSAIGDGIKSAGKGIKSAGKGLWSGITGTADFLTGGLTDFDGKGKGKYNLFGGDKEEKSKLEKLTDGGYKFDDQGVNAAGQRVITHTGPEHGQKFSKGLMGTLGIGNMGQYEKRQTGRKIITGSKANDSLEDIVAGDENLQVPQRGIGNRLLGGIDAATGNLTDFDQKGGDPFGSGRALGGIVDAATGGLTDMDKRGGKPFGLMRGLTGTVDFLTGNKFDFDKRGDGKPTVQSKLQSNENSIKDMIREVVTTPPLSDEIRPIIEVPGTNTTSQENESSNEQGAPPVATTTPISGTTCTINCVNMLKSNSVYNLNIG